MSPPQPGPTRLDQIMEQSVAVVMLRMQGLPGNRKIPGADVSVDGHQLNSKEFSSPTLRLLPPEWSTRFGKIHGKAERLVREASPPRAEGTDYPLPTGCYLIAGQRKEAIRQAVQGEIAVELESAKSDFLHAYPEIVEEKRKQIGSAAAWSQMRGRIPSVERLKSDIAIRFIVLPFTFLNEAGRALAEEMAANIAAGIAETIEEEAAKISSKIAKSSVFKEGSFTTIRQQLQLLKDFSFLADPETLRSLDDVANKLSESDIASAVNSSVKAGTDVAAALQESLAALSSEVRKDAGGRYKRRIMI